MGRRNIFFETAQLMLVKNLYMNKASYWFPIWPHFLSVLVQVVKFTQFIHFYYWSSAYHCFWYFRFRRNIPFYFWPWKVRRNNLRHAFYFFVAESIQGINSFRSAFNYFRFNINFITYKRSNTSADFMTHYLLVEVMLEL